MSCNKRLKNDKGALQPSAVVGTGSGDSGGGVTTLADRGPDPRPVAGAVCRGVDALSIDAMAIIFGFLGWKDILQARVCRRWKEAAICTYVPPTFTDHHGRFTGRERRYEFRVDSPRAYNILVGLTKALPNLQQIELQELQYGVDDGDTHHKFGEGDDAVEFVWIRDNGGYERRPAPPMRRYDVHVIRSFQKLRSLRVIGNPLNGRYPRLFAGCFSSLQKLHIERNRYLKWDIGMLAGTPQLKELVYSEASGNMCEPKEPLTGDIGDFRVLKDTLETLKLHSCPGISGDYRGLADFPCLTVLDTSVPVSGCIGGESPDWMEPGSFPNLEVLNLWSSKLLTGDIHRLQVQHFPKLRQLQLGISSTICGFDVLERIEDAAGIMQALHPLKKRSPSLFLTDDCVEDVLKRSHAWYLLRSSPDWYESEPKKTSPPTRVVFVQAGSRLGWQWVNNDWRSTSGCEVNWLDPEPCEDTDEHAEYMEELKSIQGRINVYKGFYSPPTQEEYKRVCVDFEPDYGNSESSNDEDEYSRFYDSEYNSDY